MSNTGMDESGSCAGATFVGNVSSDDNACVVCFKNVEIYSVGECDHPVCYECSTRMRVLCQQNECPICRQVLSKVIFTYEKLPYRELEAKNRSEYYNKKYKIGFYTSKIQQAFMDLLDHQCPNCNAPPYRTFNGLRNHVRVEHDLHYCDLCTEHLKIFTFERRCYTQTELGLHRVKGDADNKSHRGHPLCEYCNCRYLDRDELFRHLRRDHYFCHFCDADGFNDFYKDYNALAEHFRQDHFLCEEGKCATEQFTGAFRSEIDYKAHVANVHGKSLNKQQVKQARTLQLEITLGRRGRSGQTEQNIANVRSRCEESMNDDSLESILIQSQNNQRPLTIDAQNEQDFPSLSGTSGHSVSLIRPSVVSMRNRGTEGLVRTKENFPALGDGGIGVSNPSTGAQQRQAPSISKVLKNQLSSATGAVARSTKNQNATTNGSGNAAGMILHVSNRPASNNAKISKELDFPALPVGKLKKSSAVISHRNVTEPAALSSFHQNSTTYQPVGKSKKNMASKNRHIDEDDLLLSSTSNIPMDNVSAKHRTLVDDYVSVADPSHFQKLQLVQKEEDENKSRKTAASLDAPKLTTLDFPTLGGRAGSNISSDSKTNLWLANRKSKVSSASALFKKDNNNPAEISNKKDNKKAKENKKQNAAAAELLSRSTKKIPKERNTNNNGSNENKAEIFGYNTHANTSAIQNSSVPAVRAPPPPPGFSSTNGNNILKPPPGFQSNVIVNSVAKSPNNLTFTSSLGESYSIVPTHSYIQPLEAITRNQKLVNQFKNSLSSTEALEEFRHISQKFREGIYKAPAYYEHCRAALRDKFDYIFPELLALLPDIGKQQALFLVHSQRLRDLTIDQRKKLPSLEVCSICKQVLRTSDLENHKKLHNMKANFPTLSSLGYKNPK